MKELDDLRKELRQARKAIAAYKAKRVMATAFDAATDLVEAVKQTQKEACDTARDAKQLCDDLTDILIQLEPIP